MTDQTQIRVLYLEDDDDSREMVSFILSHAGMEVIEAITTEEAWRLAQIELFDLYLLDGLLPFGDSLKLCRDLREYAPSTPILFYSALGFPTDIKSGLAAGANGYLVKPYNGDLPETILQTIREAKASEPGFHMDADERDSLLREAVQRSQAFVR